MCSIHVCIDNNNNNNNKKNKRAFTRQKLIKKKQTRNLWDYSFIKHLIIFNIMMMSDDDRSYVRLVLAVKIYFTNLGEGEDEEGFERELCLY